MARWVGRLVLLLALVAARVAADPLVLDADTPWVVFPDEPEPVQRALDDLRRDWQKVFGHRPIVLSAPPESRTGPLLYLGTKGAWLPELLGEPLTGREAFRLAARRDAAGRLSVVAAGSDVRGGIYAVYAVSERLLGVDPWWYWTDLEPTPQQRVELHPDLDYRSETPTFEYRGWFINDEDLLSAFAPDPLRQNVFSLAMWDRIYETLLRLHGNMIVPGTFTFPDEGCQDLAARRGLVLNMHHILVVGLNTYRWPTEVPFSFNRQREVMERYWQRCIDAYRGREVVWTVGYRGKHDRPFWVDEPELTTPQARGDVVTRAMARQVAMIRRADPNAPIITNLWMEGADLMRQGFLKVPDGVTIVWPDDGTGLIRDGETVAAGQGTYYHTAMLNGSANELGEMVPPGRIYSELGRFVKGTATRFFLVNVSDIRPVPLTTDCAMRFVWDARPYLGRSDRENMDACQLDWCRRYLGQEVAAQAAALYNRWFDLPYHRRGVRQSDNALHSRLRALTRSTPPLIAAGKPLDEATLASARDSLAFADANEPLLAALVADTEALLPRVPAERRDFFLGHLVTQARLHLHSLSALGHTAQALLAYAANQHEQAVAAGNDASAAADRLLDALRDGERGKWAGWYQGECFVNLEASRDQVRRVAAALRGEPLPPVRAARGYANLYRYQEPFAANFPLLYPARREP